MEALRRFRTQASTHYRNFQVVVGALVAAYVGIALVWAIWPEWAITGLGGLDRLLGGSGGAIGDEVARVLQFVGAGYGASVALVANWLRADLRNRRQTLVPLATLLGLVAVLSVGAAWVAPSFSAGLVGVAGLQIVAMLAVSVATILAYDDIRGLSDGVLSPEPVGVAILGWTHFEARWLDSVLAATLPPMPEYDQPGFEDVELGDFWESYVRNVPLHFRLGVRVATWLVTFWPLVTLRSWHLFHNLGEEAKDEVVQEVEHSRIFVVRQATFVLKTTVGFGYFRDPAMQAQFPSAYNMRDADELTEASAGSEEAGDEKQEGIVRQDIEQRERRTS